MKRAVRTLIRLVATCFMLFGVLWVGLEYAGHRMKHHEISVWHCIFSGILIVVGLVLFKTSGQIAEQLADDFEE